MQLTMCHFLPDATEGIHLLFERTVPTSVTDGIRGIPTKRRYKVDGATRGGRLGRGPDTRTRGTYHVVLVHLRHANLINISTRSFAQYLLIMVLMLLLSAGLQKPLSLPLREVVAEVRLRA